MTVQTVKEDLESSINEPITTDLASITMEESILTPDQHSTKVSNGNSQENDPAAQSGQAPAKPSSPVSGQKTPDLIPADNAKVPEPASSSSTSDDEGSDDEVREHQEAYERSLRELLPASPDEIRRLRQQNDNREEALTDAPATLKTRTERLRLEPGFIPPEVRLTPNLVTALVFIDATGSPWPVTASVLGSGSLFATEVLEGEVRNKVIVSPLGNHGHSNLLVTLSGQDLPLVIRLSTSSPLKEGRQVDGLIVYQVEGRGPGAAPVSSLKHPEGPVSDLLYTILDGLAPPGALKLVPEPACPEALFYQLGESIFVRTGQSLLWPGHRASVTGTGGLTVYEIPAVPSLLLSTDREVKRITLTNSMVGPEY